MYDWEFVVVENPMVNAFTSLGLQDFRKIEFGISIIIEIISKQINRWQNIYMHRHTSSAKR